MTIYYYNCQNKEEIQTLNKLIKALNGTDFNQSTIMYDNQGAWFTRPVPGIYYSSHYEEITTEEFNKLLIKHTLGVFTFQTH